MDFENLYKKAKSVINARDLTEFAEAGGVGAALLTKSKNIYVGSCISTATIGFCAEQVAAANMITQGESCILKMIAVNWEGEILPPCGTCREFISQLNDENFKTEIKVDSQTIVTLQELLNYDWKEIKRKEKN